MTEERESSISGYSTEAPQCPRKKGVAWRYIQSLNPGRWIGGSLELDDWLVFLNRGFQVQWESLSQTQAESKRKRHLVSIHSLCPSKTPPHRPFPHAYICMDMQIQMQVLPPSLKNSDQTHMLQCVCGLLPSGSSVGGWVLSVAMADPIKKSLGYRELSGYPVFARVLS